MKYLFSTQEGISFFRSRQISFENETTYLDKYTLVFYPSAYLFFIDIRLFLEVPISQSHSVCLYHSVLF